MKKSLLALVAICSLWLLNGCGSVGGGTQQTATHFSVTPSPVPYVYQPLRPATVAPGGAGCTLTVDGTGFVSGAQVNWNGSALTTTFVNE